jgi:hypothetical protein
MTWLSPYLDVTHDILLIKLMSDRCIFRKQEKLFLAQDKKDLPSMTGKLTCFDGDVFDDATLWYIMTVDILQL